MTKATKEIDAAEEALEQLDALSAVNLDEVTIEVIPVKIRHYKEVPVLDDDNNPVLGEDNAPLKSREVMTRTAHIQSMVPMSLYNEMLAMENKTSKTNPAEAFTMMADFVLKIWQISEPWMSKKMLMEGIEGPYIIRLFRLFFDKAVKSMARRGAKTASTT